MKKRNTIIAIILIIVGLAVLAIYRWNIFDLNLPIWAKIPSTIVGIPFMIWGVMLLVHINRKQK